MTRSLWAVALVLVVTACNEASPASERISPEAPQLGTPCADELEKFEQDVWQPTLSVLCIGCHNAAGPAKDSRMVLWGDDQPGHLAHNFEQVFRVATIGTREQPLLLMMPSNTNPERQHPGGELFKTDSVTYATLAGFVERLWTPGCNNEGLPTDCTEPTPGPRLLRRLSPVEYDNTITDVFHIASEWGATFPADTVVDGFRNHAKSLLVTPLLADKLQAAAESIAAQVNLASWLTCDANQGADTCARDMIATLGKTLFRRPLTATDVNRYATLHQTTSDFESGCRLVITAMLQSPHFVYRSELGALQGDANDGRYALSDFEIATELAYLIWQSTPDDTLLDAATQGALHTPQQIEAQVTRMLVLPRARATVRNFVLEWLGLNAVTTVPRDAQAFPGLTQDVRLALLAEVERVIDEVAFTQGGTLADLLTTSTTFLDAVTAAHYGIDLSATTPREDGSHPVDMSAQQRSGLLTMGATMLTHARSNDSSPVHRGRFVRERLLCQVPPPPPPGLNVQPPAVDPTLTARERYAAHSVMEPCRSCHQLMDPIGFSFEHFDGIGRFRETDNGLPIDVSGEILRSEQSDGAFEGTGELATLLANSPDVERCFAQQAFRFGYGLSDSNDVRCAVDAVHTELTAENFTLKAMVGALTRGVHFATRVSSEGGLVPEPMPEPLPNSDAGPMVTPSDAGMPPLNPPEMPSDGPIARERVQDDDWGAGYCHTYKITNTSSMQVTWSITLPIDGTISHAWEAERSGDTTSVTFTGVSHNATLSPDGTTQFGFCAER